MQQATIDRAFQVAGSRWKNKDNPQCMTTRVTLADDTEKIKVNVIIYHHENFPSGGQNFTADLRKLPEAGRNANEGEFIARRRFHLM